MPISEVYNMDCMEYMKGIPNKFFDLAVVDPEYGIGIAKRNRSIGQKKGQGKITRYKSKDWDSKPPDKEYFDELFRVSKNQIIFGANYFSRWIPPSMGWIVYDKLQPDGVTFAMAELAYTSFNISTKMFRTSRANMQNCVSNNAKIAINYAKRHVAQKPVQLYAWIYKTYAKAGWKIYDSHLGSGTNRIAAYKLGFDFFATEKDVDIYNDQEEYFRRQCFGEIKTEKGTLIQTSLFGV